MNYKTQLQSIKNSTTLEKLPKNAIGFILSTLLNEHKNNIFIHITTDNFQSKILKKEVEFFSPNTKVLLFEEWDNIPYDKNSPNNQIQHERIKTLYQILKYKGDKKILIISTINSILQKIIPQKQLENNSLQLEANQKISTQELKNFLEINGYQNVNTAISTGEFSINMNALDVVKEGNKAFRIKFSQNKIKEIKKLNTSSQISSGDCKKIKIIPNNEIIFSKKYILNFKQNYKKLFGIPKQNDQLYNNVSNNYFHKGLENYLPLFYNENLETIFDYLPKETIITIDEDIKNKQKERLELINKHYQERLENIKNSLKEGSIYNPIPSKLMYLEQKELENKLNNFVNIIFSKIEHETHKRTMDLKISNIPNFYKESQKNKKNVFQELSKFFNQKGKV